MTTRAYIMIETAAGKSRDVIKALSSIPAVDAANAVTGPYDVIVEVTAQDLNEIGDLVSRRVHTINGISRTLTCFVLERS
ncbi:MAG: Lrp/AsnC ligand binding domain-containing protein [Chloroflexi bacterium]|nr:Lrp/AsnC ligand binding domain-containing protein [Chloroflexota bacterium]